MHDRLVAEPIRLTYEDFCALPDDGRRYEILDGDLYMSPSPATLHQRVVGNLYAILREHVRRHGLGEVFIAPYDVVLGTHDIVEPDVIFVSRARAAIVTEKNIQGPPDLLIEVVSPSTAERDTRDKRNLYARCGVDHYWLVDPESRSVLELKRLEAAYATVSRTEAGQVFRPGLFPGLEVAPAALWE
jgi:Uma2 family endonuclease